MLFKLDVKSQLPSKAIYFTATTKRGFKAGITRAIKKIQLSTLATVSRADANVELVLDYYGNPIAMMRQGAYLHTPEAIGVWFKLAD